MYSLECSPFITTVTHIALHLDSSKSVNTFPEFSQQHTPLFDKQDQKTFEDFLKQFEYTGEELETKPTLTKKSTSIKEEIEIEKLTSKSKSKLTSPNVKEASKSRARKRKSTMNNSESTGEPSNTEDTKALGRGKKAAQELLTEEEKKANHIASEQKRRQNIRVGFEQLVDIVPTLSQCHRSESAILQKSVEYIKQLLSQKQELKQRVKELRVSLGEPPDEPDDSSSSDDNPSLT
ncbi:Transcription factor, variant 3 [Basidiobolus ranarum]|uniref:Transcription factor, variant 3 n=1 Tax=Basidiobolus ranarum TaxID=34480 RepID=A0ABR2WYX0_9FUNG